MPNLENQCVLYFPFQWEKLLRLYHNTYFLLLCIYLCTKSYLGLWFNQTHYLLLQNISVKIYTTFFLSSGGYNFKINWLNDKIKHGMWVHILLNNLVWSPWKTGITFGIGGQNSMKKAVKIDPEIVSFKVFLR